ncbi:MAG: glycosyltransferase family 9 protein [Burkholderiales bacterium]|nr:glycosyltransferase family 9 protein [Burkholderiales bacterium]
MKDPQRILIIRRDNIGDLVLTTPLIGALRRRYPQAWIAVLANSYNAPVLDGHPDLDAVFAYDKAKHRPERSRLLVNVGTARLLLRLRRMRIDLAILAGAGVQHEAARLARWIAPRETLGFVERGQPTLVSLPVNAGGGAALHAAQDIFRLGAPLRLEGDPGPCRLAPDAGERERCRAALAAAGCSGQRVVAVHLSARRPAQRWPAQSFVELIEGLARDAGLFFVLLWSPGPAEDPRHPGDDAKAAQVVAGLDGKAPILAWPTASLAALNGALACADLMVCADGGAMHVAAGLGVPVVALFGDSPAERWRPWGVRHLVVQAPGGEVPALGVTAVAEAVKTLLGSR